MYIYDISSQVLINLSLKRHYLGANIINFLTTTITIVIFMLKNKIVTSL